MDQRYLIDYKCYKHFSRDGQKAGPNNWVEFIKRNLTPHPFNFFSLHDNSQMLMLVAKSFQGNIWMFCILV